jgi:hypothetical protein
VPAHQLLDQLQSLGRLEALEADAYAGALAAELVDEVAARDAQLADALARIDALAERAMRLRLEHALADDPAIAAPTRRVFAATVVGYADRLELLATRAHHVAARSPDPEGVATTVVDAARATLAMRVALRGPVLALVARVAAASAADADVRARDRRLDAATRTGWSALRRELEAVAAQPERVATAPFAARLAAWPPQLDEPDPASEPTFADMIELD